MFLYALLLRRAGFAMFTAQVNHFERKFPKILLYTISISLINFFSDDRNMDPLILS